MRMRISNLFVRKWLLENNYDEIWFKPHSARNDLVFTQRGNYLATDLWNLFDGMCFTFDGKLCLLQMKTNSWAKEDPLKEFQLKHKKLIILSFNVTDKIVSTKGHYKVFMRKY